MRRRSVVIGSGDTRSVRSTPARIAAALVAGLVVLAACSGDDGDGSLTTLVTTTTEASEPAPAPDPDPQPEPDPEPAPPSADGFVFTSPDGDFRVVFPAEPTSQPLSVPLPDGALIESTIFLYETMTGALLVNVSVYPDDYDASDTQGVLEGARDGALENVGAELQTSEFITLQGRDGIRFGGELEAPGATGRYEALVFVDGQRLYQAAGVAVGEQIDIDAFLASFAFTD